MLRRDQRAGVDRARRACYVINGRKWWATGAGDPRCKLCILMGRIVDPSGGAHAAAADADSGPPPPPPRSRQQSMILVPMDAEGVEVVRMLSVFGYDDAPHGHAEIRFRNVRVPLANVLHEPGAGFAIAQARLGPGRIHHCMRAIGLAEKALEALCLRAKSRRAFGALLAQHGTTELAIADSRMEVEQAQLLTLKAAHAMDTLGNKVAMQDIAMIKVAAPRDGAPRARPRDPGPRRRGRVRRPRPRQGVRRGAHAAPRRRTRRGPLPHDRAVGARQVEALASRACLLRPLSIRSLFEGDTAAVLFSLSFFWGGERDAAHAAARARRRREGDRAPARAGNANGSLG